MSDNNNDGMNKALRQLIAEGSTTSSGSLTFGDTDAADEGNNATMNGALRALATGSTNTPTVTLRDRAPGRSEEASRRGVRRR